MSYLLQEDGVSKFTLEDGSGFILLEGSSSQNFTANLSFVGAQSKKIFKGQSANLSFVGVIRRFTSHKFTANLSFIGNIAKRAFKAFTGALSFLGAFLTGKAYVRSLTASLSFIGVFSRRTNKNTTANLSFIGLIKKNISKKINANLSFIGAITKKFIMKLISGMLSFVGVIIRLRRATFVANLTFTSTFGKGLSKLLTSNLSFLGNFIPNALKYIYVPIGIIINSFSSNKDLSDTDGNRTLTTQDAIRNLNDNDGKSDVSTGTSSGILESDSTNRTLE